MDAPSFCDGFNTHHSDTLRCRREGHPSHQQRRDADNTSATMLIVECKNYSKDIANEEIDQLLGRFDKRRGRFGWMLCREVDNEKKLTERCRDLSKSGVAFILVFTDDDLHELLRLKGRDDEGGINRLLLQKYKNLIS